MINKKSNLFIHVGLPRTGTTFLQKQIFPKLEGVVFNNKHRFRDTLYPLDVP